MQQTVNKCAGDIFWKKLKSNCDRFLPGAFLVPYLIMLVVLGIPLLYMELTVGQYTRKGPVHAMATVCPLLKGTLLQLKKCVFVTNYQTCQNQRTAKNTVTFHPLGVGIASVAVSFISSVYYNLVITWSFYYLFSSFQEPLPWENCNNTWNTPNCTNYATNSSNSSTASQEFFRYRLQCERKNLPQGFGIPKKRRRRRKALKGITNSVQLDKRLSSLHGCIFGNRVSGIKIRSILIHSIT